jgi:hypothetical protein
VNAANQTEPDVSKVHETLREFIRGFEESWRGCLNHRNAA